MSDAVLSVRDLRVYYGTRRGSVRAVDGVSLEIGAGEVLGLVGESGCGKSTLGRGILGLLPEGAFSEGDVLYGGHNLVELSPKGMRRLRGPDLGLIFQEPMTRLNPLMRIEDHFAETLKRHEPDLGRAEIRTRSLETLGKMGIPPTRFRQYPYEFSGGMRQRIMIALALVLRPKLLVADEPTTSLDVIVEAQILAILADLKREFGTALHSIPGAPPNLIDPPSGCRFHPRCPDVMRVCPRKFPIPVRLGGGRRVECWLHGPESEIPPGTAEPLEREEIAVADEA